MARSQSDGERENEGRAPDAAERASLLEFLAPGVKVERASLSSFLTPAPSSRRSDAPPSSKSAKVVVVSEPGSEEGSKKFWDSPVPRPSRRSSVAPPETAPNEAPLLAGDDMPPVLATRPSVPDAPAHEAPAPPAAPAAAAPAAPAAADEESAEQLSTRDFISTPVPGDLSAVSVGGSAPPAETPSTLAPSAYDASADDREIEDDWQGKGKKPPSRGVMVGLVAAAAVLLIVAGLTLRKGASPSVANTSAPGQETTMGMPRAAAAPMELAAVIEESAPAPVDEAMARQLQQRARELLVAGQIVEGVLFARRAIAANPMDSDSYILLAAGLEDLGRWEEARNIFSQCVRRSGGTASAECRYFATQGN
jgi:hypothetical protein